MLETLDDAPIPRSEDKKHDSWNLTSYDISRNGAPMDLSAGKMLREMNSRSFQLKSLKFEVILGKHV